MLLYLKKILFPAGFESYMQYNKKPRGACLFFGSILTGSGASSQI
jgi:hypothetical protein